MKNKFINIIPGLVICFLIVFIGMYVSKLIELLLMNFSILPAGGGSPVSSIFISIILGVIIRNLFGLHVIFISGIKFTVKYALRAGIILLGLRLSLLEAVKLGVWGIPIIVISIFIGLSVTLFFTKKLNQSTRLGTLIACGTAICGVTAIMTLSPVVKAKDNEIAYAVANITIFGLIGMLFYPILAHFILNGDPVKIGLFLGTAIHDTAQVTGSALMYSQMYDISKVIDVATITKLTRNLFIIIIIPVVSYIYYKQSTAETEQHKIPKWYQLIPLFVVGFVFLSFLRTIGDITGNYYGTAFGILDMTTWENTHDLMSSIGSKYLLAAAMAAVGLSTDFRMFKGLGLKPFYIGLIAATSVGIISGLTIYLFGHLIYI